MPIALAIIITIPCSIGAGTYLASRRLKATSAYLVLSIAIFFLVSIAVGAFGVSVFFFLCSAAVSKLGGWAHAKCTDGYGHIPETACDQVMLATLLTLMMGNLMLFFIGPTVVGVGVQHQGLFFFLYSSLLLTSPSVFPFLIWMVQSSKPRPGMDEHFED